MTLQGPPHDRTTTIPQLQILIGYDIIKHDTGMTKSHIMNQITDISKFKNVVMHSLYLYSQASCGQFV